MKRARTLCFILCFIAFGALNGQVVISELMIDPSSKVALPDAEYVELFNVGSKSVQLLGWELRVGSSTKQLPSYVLPAGGFVVLTNVANADQFKSCGEVLGLTSFPALTNELGVIQLIDEAHNTVFALQYSDKWYGNQTKKQGGWSLEMINPLLFCEATLVNYTASISSLGGTPGTQNSVKDIPVSPLPLKINSLWMASPNEVCLQFNKPMDSATVANARIYKILEQNLSPIRVVADAPLFQTVHLFFAKSFLCNRIEHLQIAAMNSCVGATPEMMLNVALPDVLQLGDVMINEILYNAANNGAEFVELFNRSEKVIDLRAMLLSTSVDSAADKRTLYPFTETGDLFFPNEYCAFTSDTAALRASFPAASVGRLRQMAFPNLTASGGAIDLLARNGSILETCFYTDSLHYALLETTKGVSLERISVEESSTNKNNWHSAAQTAGFATPGLKNSQQLPVTDTSQQIVVSPKLFSPDNDGFEDITAIKCSLPRAGFLAIIRIFDLNGALVRTLANNVLLSSPNDAVTWDGTNDAHQLLPNAPYICSVWLTHPDGEQIFRKLPCYIARKE